MNVGCIGMFTAIRMHSKCILEKTKQKIYIYKRYYPENKQITLMKSSKGRSFKKLHGPYLEAYDNGTILHKGNYINGVKEGYWIEGRSRSGYYREGIKEGVWKKFSKDSILLYQENYTSGELDGSTIKYDSIGQVIYQSEYKNGEIISEAIMDTMKVVEQMPRFKGCEGQGLEEEDLNKCAQRKLLEYIYYNLRYPHNSRDNGIGGQAKLQFVVTKSGDVQDITVLNGLSSDIKRECLRIVYNMPKWIPGTQDGKPVDVIFTLPINFRIE
jgi:TonB family protein